MLALLLACVLRRREAVMLTLEQLQQRKEHWAIVDLNGKNSRIWTVSVRTGVYMGSIILARR